MPNASLSRPLPPVARFALIALALLLLAGCAVRASRPDLARLYEDLAEDPAQPPVIVIHGLAGSTLVDADSGREYWPGSLGALAFSNYRELARLESGAPGQPRLVPGGLFTGRAGVDFYAGLIDSLERIGRFQRGEPGRPVGAARRRYYLLVYDWRRDNVVAVRQLHELIEQIRRDHADPKLRVDIIAHSNGGLIAEYYLRYGPRDVLADGAAFTPWAEGAARVRRLVRLGTPQLGAVTSLERLQVGMRIALRLVPVEVLATFATPFVALPAADSGAIVDPDGNPVAIDLFDPDLWRQQRWSVFDPAVEARVAASAATPEEGAALVASLQAMFARHLRRAGRFQAALAEPLPAQAPELANFGGDCARTLARAVLEAGPEGQRLVFSPSDLRERRPGVDYRQLFYAPGDGLITRRSQVGRPGRGSDQTFFLCEAHQRLTVNPYFQNNLLYYLLAR